MASDSGAPGVGSDAGKSSLSAAGDFGELTKIVMALGREDVDAVDLFGDLDKEQAVNLWIYADEWRKAAAKIESALNRLVVSLLEGRGYEVGDLLVVAGSGYNRERCIDTPGFLDWLTQHPETIERVINPNSIRFGSLPPVVRSTFFEREKIEKAESRARTIPLEVI